MPENLDHYNFHNGRVLKEDGEYINIADLINLVTDEVTSSIKTTITDGVNDADVLATNGSHGLVTIEPNHISTLNSTTTPLGIGEIFTGVSEDILNYAIMFINVYSNVASATDGLCIQVSHDGIDWHLSECYTIEADKYKIFAHQCNSKYFRIVYTNGTVAQTDFHIEVKLCTKDALASSHRIDDEISGEDDAMLVKSVITGKRSDGIFDNVSLTNGANMKVSLEELESGISTNNNSQLNTTIYSSAGEAADINYGSLVTITHAHKEVHAGGHFVTGHLFEGVANNASAIFRISNGATKELHVIITAITELKAYGTFHFENTYTADGTEVASYNNNGGSLNVSTATFYHTPTINVLGDLRYPDILIPAGQKSLAVGGSSSNGQELIVPVNGDCTIEITSKGGAGTSNDINVILEWYEETIV